MDGFPSVCKIQISKHIAQEQGIHAITEAMQNKQMDFLNPGCARVRDRQQEIRLAQLGRNSAPALTGQSDDIHLALMGDFNRADDIG
jgi:hypothetical protein